jgi:cation:H+ antiporter
LTALIAPTAVPSRIAKFDNSFLLAVSVLLLVFAWTVRHLSRAEGAFFLAIYIVYVGYLIAAGGADRSSRLAGLSGPSTNV